MAEYIICTDTGSDLNDALYREYDIVPLKMEYEVDGITYEDDYSDEALKKFYQNMREGAVPKTSQVNAARYAEFFEGLLGKSKTIIYIGLSSGISGSYNNSLIAAKEVMEKHNDAKIYCVDTLGACLMGGMLSISASDNRKNGMSAEENVAWLNDKRHYINVYYTTPDLTYLQRGGRVSKTSAVVAHMLGINPILTVTPEGKLISCDKVRGEKQTIAKIQKNIEESIIDPANTTLYIAHSDCYDRAAGIVEKYKAEIGFGNVVLTNIGSIIGAHTGPGLVALFWYGKERK